MTNTPALATLFHNRKPLPAYTDTVKALGLVDGQDIDTETMWQVIDINAAVMRARSDGVTQPTPRTRALVKAIDEIEALVARHHGEDRQR